MPRDDDVAVSGTIVGFFLLAVRPVRHRASQKRKFGHVVADVTAKQSATRMHEWNVTLAVRSRPYYARRDVCRSIRI